MIETEENTSRNQQRQKQYKTPTTYSFFHAPPQQPTQRFEKWRIGRYGISAPNLS